MNKHFTRRTFFHFYKAITYFKIANVTQSFHIKKNRFTTSRFIKCTRKKLQNNIHLKNGLHIYNASSFCWFWNLLGSNQHQFSVRTDWTNHRKLDQKHKIFITNVQISTKLFYISHNPDRNSWITRLKQWTSSFLFQHTEVQWRLNFP